MLVHVVADYGPAGDLAFAEVTQRLVAALPGATIVATPSDPSTRWPPASWSRSSRSRAVRLSASCFTTSRRAATRPTRAAGELALAPGSSGWPLREGGERRFIELFLRGGSAAARLGRPASGTPIAISRT